MNKPPAFQFYADDFIGGTSILNTEEVGAYILLLCHQWNTGSVPNDDDLIRRIARITQAFPLGLLKSKFDLIDGVLKNARMERERDKQNHYRQKQAENGAKGGRPKSQAFPKPNPSHNPNESSPSPSPSPKEEKKADKPPQLTDSEFLEALKANPAYSGIDVAREHGKAQAWCMTNRKQCTRRFFVNWINRVEKPLAASTPTKHIFANGNL